MLTFKLYLVFNAVLSHAYCMFPMGLQVCNILRAKSVMLPVQG